jgi:hypothetical protein
MNEIRNALTTSGWKRVVVNNHDDFTRLFSSAKSRITVGMDEQACNGTVTQCDGYARHMATLSSVTSLVVSNSFTSETVHWIVPVIGSSFFGPG